MSFSANDTIDEQLKIFAQQRNWNKVKELCSSDAKEKPSRTAVVDALHKAAQFGELGVITALTSIATGNKPDQKDVSTLLVSIVNSSDLFGVGYQNKWETIKLLCALQGENQPTIEAMNAALRHAVIYRQIELIKNLTTLTTSNKPAQNIVSQQLQYVLNAFNYAPKWEVATLLCSMQGDNQPNVEAMNAALRHAVLYCQIGVIKKLTTITTDNKPTQDFVSQQLKYVLDAFDYKQKWEVATLLCSMQGDNQPNVEAMNAALRYAVLYRQIDVIKNLTTIATDNKPTQDFVSKQLSYILDNYPNDNKKWEAVSLLCNMQGDNQPDQQAMNAALRYAVLYRQIDVIKNLTTITDVIKNLTTITTDNKPSQECVSKQLIYILDNYPNDNKRWEVVSHLCNMQGDNQPDEKAMSYALEQAAFNKKFDLVQELTKVTTRNKPSQQSVSHLLLELFDHSMHSANRWELVKILCSMQGDNQPDAETKEIVLEKAKSAGQTELIELLTPKQPAPLQDQSKPLEDNVALKLEQERKELQRKQQEEENLKRELERKEQQRKQQEVENLKREQELKEQQRKQQEEENLKRDQERKEQQRKQQEEENLKHEQERKEQQRKQQEEENLKRDQELKEQQLPKQEEEVLKLEQERKELQRQKQEEKNLKSVPVLKEQQLPKQEEEPGTPKEQQPVLPGNENKDTPKKQHVAEEQVTNPQQDETREQQEWLEQQQRELPRVTHEVVSNFNRLLNELEKKVTDLNNRKIRAQAEGKTKSYHALNLACTRADMLHQCLSRESEKYFANPTQASYKKFQETSETAIELARPILEKHRGWTELLGNIGLAILGAGVLYLIAIGINRIATGRNYLFFKTQSEQIIDGIEKQVSLASPKI